MARQSEHTPRVWCHEGPIFDFNRGVSDRCHINFEVPWVVLSADGKTSHGIGSGAIGSKIRFCDARGSRPAISIHPAVEFELSRRSTRLGLSARETSLTLPIAFQWEAHGFGLSAEVGTVMARHSHPGWTAGFAVGRAMGKSELLTEIHGEGVTATGESVWVGQLGLRHDFSEANTLLLAFGRSLSSHRTEPVRWMSNLALQLKF